jgi:hypothetical protein
MPGADRRTRAGGIRIDGALPGEQAASSRDPRQPDYLLELQVPSFLIRSPLFKLLRSKFIGGTGF